MGKSLPPSLPGPGLDSIDSSRGGGRGGDSRGGILTPQHFENLRGGGWVGWQILKTCVSKVLLSLCNFQNSHLGQCIVHTTTESDSSNPFSSRRSYREPEPIKGSVPAV